ncbi:DUF4279 domain-containing protein [Amycolatopsis alba]|uniref:DUF4279 domain-containing protein n=1 Tax=Amycolatopsis alba TaxID=76020 RepID=UPI0011789FCE
MTRLLDLRPSRAFEVGDPVGRRPGAIRRMSLWLLSSDLPPDGELADHLHWLLDRGRLVLLGGVGSVRTCHRT